jgi:ABC-type uncharacterized transport system involved in gliding motility auxiliary subunit
MLSSWGADVKPYLVLDNSSHMVTARLTQNGRQFVSLVQYPLWVNVPASAGSSAHPVTTGFAGADLFWPNPVVVTPPAGVQAVTLFTSGPDSWLQTRNLAVDPSQSYLFDAEAADTQGPHTLAAALSGKMPSFFRDKPKPTREGVDAVLPDIPEEAADARIIVVGNVDFATQLMENVGSDRNMDFIVKAADWLGNDDDIIGIRNRPAGSGRLDKIASLDKKAAAAGMAKATGFGIMPALVLVLAFYLTLARRRRQSRAQGAETAAKAAAKEETKC